MVTDTERNYRGTNFAVITLIALLVLVGGYFVVANINDVVDDPAMADSAPVPEGATNPGAL